MVVKENGRYVQAAVVSRIPLEMYYTWPPKCYCNCNNAPEEHTKVTAALPWISQFLKERNMEVIKDDFIKN